VQSHLSNLYTKLGIAGRAEAIAFAVSHSLV
jgi:DNA-binding CsgD family transcriptional regulator